MPIIDFEGVADPGSVAVLPANYAGFKWKNAFAAHKDTEITGVQSILQSGDATGLLGFDNFKAVMKSKSGDFSLIDGGFAAAYFGTAELKVKGIDDGVIVAKQKFTLDTAGSFETFKAAFASIDKVKFKFSGSDIAVEDLQVQFDAGARFDDWALT